MTDTVKIMVVDDTITYRMILQKVLETIPHTSVVASAPNGKIALAKMAAHQPDVVLLDVEMPEMDGLTTLEQIRKRYPAVTVVMVSGLSRSNANIVMECLNAGALDFVTKPQESNPNLAREALYRDLEPILSLIAKKKQPFAPPVAPIAPPVVPTPVVSRPLAAPAVVHTPGKARRPDLLLIGCSTGGPAALSRVLGDIRRNLPVPTLIVQHMPPVFTASLAAQLTRSSGMDVREAQEGMAVQPGNVILAMGGRHMVVQSQGKGLITVLNDAPKVNECRPAVDMLFMSVAASFSGQVLAVILTGMGRDGAGGIDALKRGGNTYCITQDKESCVVYGMPRAVDELGLSDEALPLDQIGPRIVSLCK